MPIFLIILLLIFGWIIIGIAILIIDFYTLNVIVQDLCLTLEDLTKAGVFGAVMIIAYIVIIWIKYKRRVIVFRRSKKTW